MNGDMKWKLHGKTKHIQKRLKYGKYLEIKSSYFGMMGNFRNVSHGAFAWFDLMIFLLVKLHDIQFCIYSILSLFLHMVLENVLISLFYM